MNVKWKVIYIFIMETNQVIVFVGLKYENL